MRVGPVPPGAELVRWTDFQTLGVKEVVTRVARPVTYATGDAPARLPTS